MLPTLYPNPSRLSFLPILPSILCYLGVMPPPSLTQSCVQASVMALITLVLLMYRSTSHSSS